MVDFHQQLAVLQRTGRALHGAPLHDGYAPSAAVPPATPHRAPITRPAMPRHDVMRRRRDVLVTLASATGLTFLLGLAFGGNVWILHLLADAALLGYVALLLQIKQARQHRANVRYLPAPHHPSATQQALLRRSAN